MKSRAARKPEAISYSANPREMVFAGFQSRFLDGSSASTGVLPDFAERSSKRTTFSTGDERTRKP